MSQEEVVNRDLNYHPRPSKIEYFLNIAENVKTRATCCRKQVGCVLVDKRGHILSTGYNGTASGLNNCTLKNPCHLDAIKDSTMSFTKCEAIHAEQNALLQCKDVQKIHTAYVTLSPCIVCIKLLLNTSCQHIVFGEKYHSSKGPLELWESAERTYKHFQQ